MPGSRLLAIPVLRDYCAQCNLGAIHRSPIPTIRLQGESDLKKRRWSHSVIAILNEEAFEMRENAVQLPLSGMLRDIEK